MQHTKSYITSETSKEAVDLLYREIETLERKVNELEDRLNNLENERK